MFTYWASAAAAAAAAARTGDGQLLLLLPLRQFGPQRANRHLLFG